jgi:hypothetical protein
MTVRREIAEVHPIPHYFTMLRHPWPIFCTKAEMDISRRP